MNQPFLTPAVVSLSLSLASIIAPRPAVAAVHPAGPISTAPAAALKTYTNAASHYSFEYPATWTATRGHGFDITLIAPKSDGGFITASIKGTQSAARIRQSLDQLLGLIAPVQGTIARGTRLISGVRFQTASDRGKDRSNGTLSDNTAYGASYHGITYLFLGGYDLNRATTTTLRAQLPAVVRSIRIS